MIFLRHPTTNAGPDVCYGQTDVGLGASAEAEIRTALANVKPVRAIHASDLTRCRIVAERFAARDGVQPVYDERLREYDFGDWEGRRWDQIPRAESDPWIEDMWSAIPPGGESFDALHKRVAAALSDIAEGSLIVAHSGVIRAAKMIITGASFETVFAENIPFCLPLCFQSHAA